MGPEFDQREAAIAFPQDNPLRRQIDTTLIALEADGTYGRIYNLWFGDRKSP